MKYGVSFNIPISNKVNVHYISSHVSENIIIDLLKLLITVRHYRVLLKQTIQQMTGTETRTKCGYTLFYQKIPLNKMDI